MLHLGIQHFSVLQQSCLEYWSQYRFSYCCRISDSMALSIDLIFLLFDHRDVIVQVVQVVCRT